MSATSSIEWTDRTWNPVRGCSMVSPGCVNCYAMKQAHRFSGKGKAYEGLTKQTSAGPQWTGKIRTVESALTAPLSWPPCRVFVNSMSDLFHEGVPFDFIDKVFAVMALTPHLTYQILTKRPEQMREYLDYLTSGRRAVAKQIRSLIDPEDVGLRAADDAATVFLASLKPLPNVWLGVSAENQEQADKRIPQLLKTPAAVRFVSYEPALGPIDFTNIRYRDDDADCVWNALTGDHEITNSQSMDAVTSKELDGNTSLDWIIVGGESGPRARDFAIEWARTTVDQCRRADVACFVKQIGPNPVESGRRALLRHGSSWLFRAPTDRKGGDMAEWPEDLRVRQFPKAVA